MASQGIGRVIYLYLVCVELTSAQYTIPDVSIQALKPKGIRVSIPDSPGVSLFVFQGNLNKKIENNDVGLMTGEITKPTNGRWLFEDLDVALKIGDVINYYLFVVHDGKGYMKDSLSFTVQVLEDAFSTPAGKGDCAPTQTLVRNGQACAGQIIFDEKFDSLREDVWQIEQYIPDEPDYPFVSYQRPLNAPTVTVRDGNLRIEPKLQQNLPGFSNSSIEMGMLDLIGGCTAISTKCHTEAWGASILPPIVSGRLTSKTFAFTYGVVEVRARLPQGDWLYPDILLESFLKKYGVLNYASGVVRIAGSRGNGQLSDRSFDIGNKMLYGGILMDAKCRDVLQGTRSSSRPWGDEFHVYAVRWTPDEITLTVDGEEWARFAPTGEGLRDSFSDTCDVPRRVLTTGSKLAPFDDHFVIALGVAAGGITEFPDDVTSAGKPKPWKNASRKDHPFVSYQRLTSDPNVFVENGTLHIVPKLQQNLLKAPESVLSGLLDLSDGCTRSLCSKQAFGADILPPIVSGRLASYSFSFTYGTVYVRAKVPKGDWLYPEILLEPLLKKYGSKFGGKYNLPETLKVTLADGNRVNNDDRALADQIYYRAQLGLGNCGASDTELTTQFDHEYWGDDFHVYALRWTPDEIKLTVDGDEYFYWIRQSLCENITSAFDYLHLTLGVAAGGDTMFPDNSTTGNSSEKPWRNGDPKASFRFWQELRSWLPTWTQPSLIIDYVKVVAL